ncbi:MAG: hypothetical protein ACM3YF_00025 [Candidatus Zixiibacteriota bacterium]
MRLTVNIFLTILDISLALILVLLGLLKREKNKTLFTALIVLIGILTIVVTVWKDMDQAKDTEKVMGELGGITKRADSLLMRGDSLEIKVAELSGEIAPFLKKAKRSYPNLSEKEALDKLLEEVSSTNKGVEKLQGKLEFLGGKQKNITGNNSTTLVTSYFFRAKHPVDLVDVSIMLRFDNVIDSAKHSFFGAVVYEQGTKWVAHPDAKGFSYTTGLLQKGNQIILEVYSKKPIEVEQMELTPK